MNGWQSFYEGIILSEEEIKEAILQGKIAKYFREKNAPYWEEKERKKVGKKVGSHRGNW